MARAVYRHRHARGSFRGANATDKRPKTKTVKSKGKQASTAHPFLLRPSGSVGVPRMTKINKKFLRILKQLKRTAAVISVILAFWRFWEFLRNLPLPSF